MLVYLYQYLNVVSIASCLNTRSNCIYRKCYGVFVKLVLYSFIHVAHGYGVLLKIIVINLSVKKWTRNNTPMGMYPKTYTLKCFYTIVVMYNLYLRVHKHYWYKNNFLVISNFIKLFMKYDQTLQS